MRRAKMERLLTEFVVFLLLIATATTATATIGANDNAANAASGGASGAHAVTKSGAAPRMGGAAPRTGGYVPKPGGYIPKPGGAPPRGTDHKTGGAAPKMGGAPPPPTLLPQEQEFLNAHNEVRYHSGLPPLKWDPKVAAYARWYANSRKKDCALQHSTGPFGENLFWGEGRTWTPKLAVKDWVREHRFYNRMYHKCQPNQMCGHYTQIVWRDTQKVGCGMVLCGPGDTFVVCSYDPPGNWQGKRPFEKHNQAMYNQQERLQRISWIPNY